MPQIIITTTRELADDIRKEEGISDLEKVTEEKELSLKAITQKETNTDLDQMFYIDVEEESEAKAIVEEVRKLLGVEAAYVKPDAEAPL